MRSSWQWFKKLRLRGSEGKIYSTKAEALNVEKVSENSYSVELKDS